MEESIGVDIGYATRIFRVPEGARDWKAMAVYATAPRSHRLGVVFPIENDRWIVTLVGLRGHYPRAANDDEFLEFARSLEQPDLYEAIRHAEPDGPIHLIRYATRCGGDSSACRRDRQACCTWATAFAASIRSMDRA